MAFLELKNVSADILGSRILNGVSMTVDSGEAVAVVGANGAGKTTLLRTISGLVRVSRGDIRIDGRSTARMPAHRISRLGVGHVPEGRQVFAALTVLENLQVGARDSAQVDQVLELFPMLAGKRDASGGSLSGGQQQMLALARALVPRPRLLLMDEPSLGIAPAAMEEIIAVIKQTQAALDYAMVLVEQTSWVALELVERVCVMQRGSLVAEGPAAEILTHDNLISAYFT
ncbi:ABC transporter ATP-binding protein [Actinomadura macra]|uniref:ABC transporter ATP-binding protein n=1 Tax=Actinomadura macra TaxID=46164 RepID=UPI000834AD36|nr:ABC transporter ATP-binding protein [Actinomadura macra]